MRWTIGQWRANALANANTSQLHAAPGQHPHPLPPLHLPAPAHPIYRVVRAYLSKKNKQTGALAGQPHPEYLFFGGEGGGGYLIPTAKKYQVLCGLRMVRRAVHPVLGHLGPRDDLQLLQSLAQCGDLRRLLLATIIEHKRVLVGCDATRMARLQQGSQSRAQSRQRTGLPLLLSGEQFEIELVMTRPFRFPRTLFSCQTLFLALPSQRFLFLLHHGT
jgi:hypothetical protein